MRVIEQLEQLKQKLLDLSVSNKLISYRENKTKTIRITSPDITTIFSELVIENTNLEFGESTENKVKLSTDIDKTVLYKKLVHVYNHAKTIFEEQGNTVLYMALGFVNWKDDKESIFRKAPLILVPLTLERCKAKSPFKVYWTNEDIGTNLSLKEYFSRLNIFLPDYNGGSVREYFNSVRECLNPDWNITEEAYIDFFNFKKFIMYQDINELLQNENIRQDSIVNSLLDPITYPISYKNNIPVEIGSLNTYHVLDADSSQSQVIESIKLGNNLVVEGPPGTGKSQTIANAIVELLVKGKKVLFVSEKMAALNVVKRRLEQVGIGDFCLELHSQKANKKVFLKDLQTSLSIPAPKITVDTLVHQRVDALREELNKYIKLSLYPVGNIKKTPQELFEMKEQAENHFNSGCPCFEIRNIENLTTEEYNGYTDILQELTDTLNLISDISKHVFSHCYPMVFSPFLKQEMGNLLDLCTEDVNACMKYSGILHESYGFPVMRNIVDYNYTVNLLKLIIASEKIDVNVFGSGIWDKSLAESLIRQIMGYRGRYSNICKRFKPDIFVRLTLEDLEFVRNKNDVFWKPFSPKYKRIIKVINDCYLTRDGNGELLYDITELIEVMSAKQSIRTMNTTGEVLFGNKWNNENSDLESLCVYPDWNDWYQDYLRCNNIQSIDVFQNTMPRDYLNEIKIKLELNYANFIEHQNRLVQILNPNYNKIFNKSKNYIEFEKFKGIFKIWKKALPELHIWTNFVRLSQKMLNTAIEPILGLIYEKYITSDEIIPCFEFNVAANLIHHIFRKEDTLRFFIGDSHNTKIQQFRELDRQMIQQNKNRVLSKLYKQRPDIIGGEYKDEESFILLNEFNKKKNNISIRKLMSMAGRVIQKVKPCFMMSPLSIAQYLEPGKNQFDVVIFDEASQIRPEDAVGAFVRADQAVVIGDTQQLPPTNFFDVNIDTDSEDSITNMESILNLCKCSFPVKMLKWHYRSKHESLITVSNEEFYGNTLMVYPSAIRDKSGLHFMYSPDTVYDRGNTSINKDEAKIVASSIISHYKDNPNKSLGVGTFNIKQQQAILEELDNLLRENSDVEDAIKANIIEPLFVKNLETIQGDERDVIFVSTGFGFDSKKNLSSNFGPINQSGGERRLNVLMTRAREDCFIFANFRAADLRVDNGTAVGVKVLKRFLDYAEHAEKKEQKNEEIHKSQFEQSVYQYLTDCGFEVHSQVGQGTFKVDLGVIDPNKRGQYILGIECDGDKYNSFTSTRDRDRISTEVLEKMGWKIIRIWSVDWYNNRQEIQEKLSTAIGTTINRSAKIIDFASLKQAKSIVSE